VNAALNRWTTRVRSAASVIALGQAKTEKDGSGNRGDFSKKHRWLKPDQLNACGTLSLFGQAYSSRLAIKQLE
jgi:hypothetical protein